MKYLFAVLLLVSSMSVASPIQDQRWSLIQSLMNDGVIEKIESTPQVVVVTIGPKFLSEPAPDIAANVQLLYKYFDTAGLGLLRVKLYNPKTERFIGNIVFGKLMLNEY